MKDSALANGDSHVNDRHGCGDSVAGLDGSTHHHDRMGWIQHYANFHRGIKVRLVVTLHFLSFGQVN